jgi:uncharacterized repeat protein (TIGR01451 family)
MADLVMITKAAAPNPVNVGGDLTYTLVVSNSGPDAANGVVVTDNLPSGVTLLSASPSQGSCSGTAPVTCNIGTLGVGSNAVVTLVVRPTQSGALTNTASVSAGIFDPNTANNQKSVQTSVLPSGTVAGGGGEGTNTTCNPSKPRSSISRNGSRITRAKIRLTGRTLDLRCAGTNRLGGIRRARLAIAQIVGSRCRFVQKNGSLTAPRSCSRRLYLNAHLGRKRAGKVPWTFRLKVNLAAGRYVVTASGIDSQGLKETKLRKFNRKTFRLR